MSLLDEAVGKAKLAADATAKKASEILDITKYTIKLAEVKNSLDKAYMQLGKLVYSSSKNAEFDIEDNSTSIEDKMVEIAELVIAVSSIEDEIAVKKGLKKCPSCGKINAKDSVYCNSCAVEL